MFSSDYIQGYTAALQDVLKTISLIQDDLKCHRRKQNYKTYKNIAECMLRERTFLRENPAAFIRCNDDVNGGFEIYIDKKL